ncbi:hypothetical protein VaNZ11_012858 [Volvox africanus]|uniref:Glycosyltransferase (GlcNAc) n=1 Tax=Volvox africanus TaxID=51714 RepID=A0ABQ5SG53_9CHLO|nr:hypothetical protein VaNZ11_012858 [Volvox africanus]
MFQHGPACNHRGCNIESIRATSPARRPENVFAGVVTYTLDEAGNGAGSVANITKTGGGVSSSNHTLAAERCESAGLARFERNIRRLSLGVSSAKGPSLSRYQAATMYDGEQYLLQIDSHMRFASGWDVELLRMIREAPSRNAVLTHYPPSWDDMSERRVPAMCLARWVEEAAGQRVLMLEAALMDPPPSGQPLRPVPFAAAGFMFAPAHVLENVPFDPSLDYLFHGEEALYSARLWTHGWDMFTPDRNVAFHHYSRDHAPKFWNDFDANPSYHTQKAGVLRKVEALMLSEYGTGGFKYGMGRQRTVRQWWQYAGLDPSNRSQVMDMRRFCWVQNADRHHHRQQQQQWQQRESKGTSGART